MLPLYRLVNLWTDSYVAEYCFCDQHNVLHCASVRQQIYDSTLLYRPTSSGSYSARFIYRPCREGFSFDINLSLTQGIGLHVSVYMNWLSRQAGERKKYSPSTLQVAREGLRKRHTVDVFFTYWPSFLFFLYAEGSVALIKMRFGGTRRNTRDRCGEQKR